MGDLRSVHRLHPCLSGHSWSGRSAPHPWPRTHHDRRLDARADVHMGRPGRGWHGARQRQARSRGGRSFRSGGFGISPQAARSLSCGCRRGAATLCCCRCKRTEGNRWAADLEHRRRATRSSHDPCERSWPTSRDWRLSRTMSPRAIEDSDGTDGAPHPRATTALFGHAAAQATLLDAYRSGRIPHAFLIAGPQGIGKATLAYRMARFVLAHPDPSSPQVQTATSLAIEANHPVARRIAAQTQPDLLVLERTFNDKGALHKQIAVEDIRRTVSFFGSTAGEGGWRIAVVDAVDELNRAGANALLKVLEEPPARALLFLISHSAARVPPTCGRAAVFSICGHWHEPISSPPLPPQPGLRWTRGKSPPQRALRTAAWRAPWRCWTRTRWRCASRR